MYKLIFKCLHIVVLVCSCYQFSHAQEGIKFLEVTSLAEAFKAAQQSEKPIFIDAFTTWCGPCKAMDQNVYSNAEVGKFYNENFINVRLQFDKTNGDNINVKRLYLDVADLQARYEVKAFPTYLFISSEGILLNRDLGIKSNEDFIEIGRTALYPKSRLIRNIAAFRNGKLDYKELPALIIMAKKEGEMKLADSIADHYINSYLNRLPEAKLLTKENLNWIEKNLPLLKPDSRVFKTIKRNAVTANKNSGFADYANYITNAVVYNWEIWNKVKINDSSYRETVDWTGIENAIRSSYPQVDAFGLVTNAKVEYYYQKNEWRKFAELRDSQMHSIPLESKLNKTKPGYGDAWMLNSAAWEVFEGTADTVALNVALKWVNEAFVLDAPDPNIQFYDTKANILYRLGRTEEALTWERNAVIIEQQNAIEKKTPTPFTNDYLKIIEKMVRSEPTWPDRNNK